MHNCTNLFEFFNDYFADQIAIWKLLKKKEINTKLYIIADLLLFILNFKLF